MRDKVDVDPRVFDPTFYLAHYPDVADSGEDPETHYMTKGWREGKDPSAHFSTTEYLQRYPDIRAADINPFVHFVRHGYDEGRRTGLSASASADIAGRLSVLLAHEATPPEMTEREPPATPEELAALLMGSRQFSSSHFARQTGARGSRAELVARYLDTPPGRRPAASPDFDPGFYRRTYLSDAPEGDPLIDWVLRGQALGHYPNALRAEADTRLIRTRAGIDRRHYLWSLGTKPVHADTVRDYVLHGAPLGAEPRQRFDGDFLRDTYMRRAGISCAPYAYFLRNRQRQWMFQDIHELAAAYQALSEVEAFDPGCYSALAGIDPERIDPLLHYILRGVQRGLPTSPDFHTGFYLATYRDLQAARVNPLLHFWRHGRHEGRRAVPPTKALPRRKLSTPGGKRATPGRPRAIVVSHEASFTGAPIVALNIARALSATHDVITWLGKTGPLTPDFAEVSTRMIMEFPPVLTGVSLLEEMRAEGGIDFAVVNSAISGATLEPLKLAGIPALLLVHDFANYVYPRGSLSRMVLNADISVFPAQIVADAVADEMSHMGLATLPGTMRIAHQGYNGTGRSDSAAITPRAIRERLGLTDRPDVRILFGGGWVQPRKGVDLFLQAAARLAQDPGQEWRFIWVGGNYRPDDDMIVSAYLADQVAKSGLADRFAFFEEQPDLESFWEVADVFFLSSRLDPFPNIALDALMRDVPVVCFQGATGIAELTDRFGFCVRAVPFCDSAAAAEEISALGAGLSGVHAEFRSRRSDLEIAFSFETYVARLIGFAEEARRSAAEQAQLRTMLLERPPAELAAAAATVPEWAHLARSGSPEVRAATVAAMLVNGGPIGALRIGAGEPVEREVPASGHVMLAPPRDAPVPPGAWMLHVHAPDADALAALVAAEMLPEAALVVVTSPRGALEVPEGVRSLADPCFDAFDGLAAAMEAYSSTHVSHADLSLGTAGPAAWSFDPAFVGSVLAGDRPGFAAAVPDCGPGYLPRSALERLGGELPESPVAPLFAGLFEAARMARFLEESRPAYVALRAGLEPRAATALRALMFARACDADGALTLLCPDQEVGLVEEIDVGLRHGVPEVRPRGVQGALQPLVIAMRSESPASFMAAAARLWRGLRQVRP
ncbi:glycosyltransferase [Paroceanicella profunda]|uniref:Glycosyltransferase n=1 Tax=Paroceanicella profunda TaxID=2579971 RepID=A0A5B8FY71_9RHOB|nr:glycosyltransferase [Paroceanicella profunda]QDL91559.1 glycosyltransferase [Paroceanicella profunda]